MKKLAEVSADATSYTVKKLKQGTYYKYQIKAYQMIDGEQGDWNMVSTGIEYTFTDGYNFLYKIIKRSVNQ